MVKAEQLEAEQMRWSLQDLLSTGYSFLQETYFNIAYYIL